jgi:hypothetical protein
MHTGTKNSGAVNFLIKEYPAIHRFIFLKTVAGRKTSVNKTKKLKVGNSYGKPGRP